MSWTSPSNPSSRSTAAALAPAREAPTIAIRALANFVLLRECRDHRGQRPSRRGLEQPRGSGIARMPGLSRRAVTSRDGGRGTLGGRGQGLAARAVVAVELAAGVDGDADRRLRPHRLEVVPAILG